MKIVVTGAAGFIGSNIVKGLNQRGFTDIIAVDDLRDGEKFRNLADLHIADYIDPSSGPDRDKRTERRDHRAIVLESDDFAAQPAETVSSDAHRCP